MYDHYQSALLYIIIIIIISIAVIIIIIVIIIPLTSRPNLYFSLLWTI